MIPKSRQRHKPESEVRQLTLSLNDEGLTMKRIPARTFRLDRWQSSPFCMAVYGSPKLPK